jgi:hypothetical protein
LNSSSSFLRQCTGRGEGGDRGPGVYQEEGGGGVGEAGETCVEERRITKKEVTGKTRESG